MGWKWEARGKGDNTWGNYQSCKFFKGRQEIFCGHVKQKEKLILRVLCGELTSFIFPTYCASAKFSHEIFCISIEEFKNIFTLLQKPDFWHCHTIHFCKHAVKYYFFSSNLHSNNSLLLAISEGERKKIAKRWKNCIKMIKYCLHIYVWKKSFLYYCKT